MMSMYFPGRKAGDQQSLLDERDEGEDEKELS